MPSSDDLWNAFAMVKDEVVGNTRELFAEGLDSHLLRQNLETRKIAKATIDNTLSALSRMLCDLRRVKEQVLKTENIILRSIGRVHSLQSPIGILPTELIH